MSEYIGNKPAEPLPSINLNDLTDVSTSGATAGDLLSFGGSTWGKLTPNYATSAQGSLADSAVQPGDNANTLGSTGAAAGTFLGANGSGGVAWTNLPNVDTLSSGGAAAGTLLSANGSGGSAFITRNVSTNNGLTGGGALTADLTLGLTGQALAVHNLATNGVIARTGSGTVAGRTITGTANQVTVTNGDGVSGNPTLSLPQDIHTSASPTFAGATLNGNVGVRASASASVSTQIPVFTADPASTTRTLVTRTPAQIRSDIGAGTGNGSVTSIATGNGITGGTITTTGTLELTGQALAVHNLATNGVIARTGSGTVAGRTITASTGISVSNGDGVSGNPTITNTAPHIATNLTVTGGTTAGPTINSSTGTNVTIPTASGSASGVVTTGDQTFAGVKTFSGRTVLQGQIETTPGSNLGTGGTLTIDLASSSLRSTGTLATAPTFAVSNLAAGRSATVRVINGGSSLSVGFNADWKFVGPKPTNIAASKVAILTVTAFGTTNADVVAAWAVQE